MEKMNKKESSVYNYNNIFLGMLMAGRA